MRKLTTLMAVAGLMTSISLPGPALAADLSVAVLGCVFSGKTLLVDSLNLSADVGKIEIKTGDFCADALALLIREQFSGDGTITKESNNPAAVVFPMFLPPNPGIVDGAAVKMFWTLYRAKVVVAPTD